MRRKWLLLGLITCSPSFAAVEEISLNEEEQTTLIKQIDTELREEPWNSEVLEIRAYRYDAGTKAQFDGATVFFEPFLLEPTIKKSVVVHCSKFPSALQWECSKDTSRYVRSEELDFWVKLLSEELTESEALQIVDVLGKSESLISKEDTFTTTVQELGHFGIGLSWDGEAVSVHSDHPMLGPISLEISRNLGGKEIEILDLVQFFTVCNNGEMRYGPNPCNAEK